LSKHRKTLSQELAELESKDPAVAAAARKYDETIDRILGRRRIDRFVDHRNGLCDPTRCEYRHTPEERGGEG
jgi:hypothetical protein